MQLIDDIFDHFKENGKTLNMKFIVKQFTNGDTFYGSNVTQGFDYRLDIKLLWDDDGFNRFTLDKQNTETLKQLKLLLI